MIVIIVANFTYESQTRILAEAQQVKLRINVTGMKIVSNIKHKIERRKEGKKKKSGVGNKLESTIF